MTNDELYALWAPWRCGYILGPKPAACVFCEKAQAPAAHDRENLVLERASHNFVLMNTYPYNAGHLLVTPYQHSASLEALAPAALHEMMDLLVRWKQRLERGMRAQGVNIGINLGAVAGAGITEHVHAHIVPRWQGDTNFMSTTADTRVISQALQELYDILMIAQEQQ